MKPVFVSLFLCIPLIAVAQNQKTATPPTLKSILLEELRSTHNVEDWFAPANIAVEGLTAEQASWTDGKGNHSVGQLANHMAFWDERSLQKFKGEPQAKFSGNNDETFNSFDAKQWAETVKRLDDVMTQWERAVESADEKKLEEWASTIGKIATHNAYHVGQMVYVRKEQGSWNPDKGVK